MAVVLEDGFSVLSAPERQAANARQRARTGKKFF